MLRRGRRSIRPNRQRVISVTAASLENDLRRNLHVEGLTRPNPRPAKEIADGVGDEPTGPDGAASSREVDSIEDVKHFRAKLQF